MVDAQGTFIGAAGGALGGASGASEL